jgi:hypothetical protein
VARLNAFFNDPITLPRDWQEVKPFPPDLVAAADKVREEFWKLPSVDADGMVVGASTGGSIRWREASEARDGHRRFLQPPTLKDGRSVLQKALAGEPLSSEDWGIASGKIKSTTSILAAAESMVRHASYEMAVLPITNPPWLDQVVDVGGPWSDDSDCFTLNNIALLFSLRSHLAAREDQCGDAINDSLLTLRAAIRHPASTQGTMFRGLAMTRTGCKALSLVINDCFDQHLLSTASDSLATMNTSASFVLGASNIVAETIGNLRRGVRLGKVLDLSRKVPAGDWFRERYHSMTSLLTDQEKGFNMGDLVVRGSTAIGLPLEESIVRTIYVETCKFRWMSLVQEEQAKALYDLLRLDLANRITLLESGKRTTQTSDFVPRFFATDPIDPFTDGPYLWDSTHENFYSPGPDKLDQKDAVVLNPKTYSGDVSLFLEGKWQRESDSSSKDGESDRDRK